MVVDAVSRFLRRRVQVTERNLDALEHDLSDISDSCEMHVEVLISGLVVGVTTLIGVVYAAASHTVNGGL